MISLPAFFSTNQFNLSALADLLRVIALSVSLGSLCFLLMNASDPLRRHAFPFSLALAFIVLLVGYRFLIGAGLHGFLYFPEDNFSYASWGVQAREGAVLFEDRFTVENHSTVYFNLFYLILGNLSRFTGIPVIPLMIVCGILSSSVVILSAFYICCYAGLGDSIGRWAAILAAFSSGVSVPLYFFGIWTGLKIPAGADLRHLDSILFSTFFAHPYQSCTYAMQALLVIWILRCEQENSKSTDLILLGAGQAILLLSRPYEWVLMLSGYGLYLLWPFFSGSQFQSRRLKIFLVLAIVACPIVLYNWWLSHQPVWENFAQISLSQQKFPLYWILGYGILIPAALVGAWQVFRLQAERIRWIALSALVSLLLLIVFNVKQVKAASCGPLFLCITAAIGFHHVRSKLSNAFCAVLLFPCAIFLLGGSIFLMIAYFKNNTYDKELENFRSDLSSQKILCDTQTGNVLPVISGARVYAGHWALTPGYLNKKQDLIAAGIEDSKSTDGATFDSFKKLLQKSGCNLILINKDRPAFQFVKQMPEVKLLRCSDKWCLYALSPQSNAIRLDRNDSSPFIKGEARRGLSILRQPSPSPSLYKGGESR